MAARSPGSASVVLAKIALPAEARPVLTARRPGELQRRDPVAALEMLGQRALIVEAGRHRNLGDLLPAPQMTTGRVQSHLRQVGVRGQTDGTLEETDQLKGGQTDHGGKLVEPERVGMKRPHRLDRLAQGGSIARRRGDASAAAAVPAKQPPERADQQLPLAEEVAALLESTMQREEPVYEIAIAEHIAREIGHLGDAETTSDLVDGGSREIERAVAPMSAVSHPALVRLGRVEDEEFRGVRRLHRAAALDDRAAELGYGDDEGFVAVRRIFMRGEIGMHQAETRHVAGPPGAGTG